MELTIILSNGSAGSYVFHYSAAEAGAGVGLQSGESVRALPGIAFLHASQNASKTAFHIVKRQGSAGHMNWPLDVFLVRRLYDRSCGFGAAGHATPARFVFIPTCLFLRVSV